MRSCLFANTRTGTVLNFSSSKSSASCLKLIYDKNWIKKKIKALSTVPYRIWGQLDKTILLLQNTYTKYV